MFDPVVWLVYQKLKASIRTKMKIKTSDEICSPPPRTGKEFGTKRIFVWDRQTAETEIIRHTHIIISITDPRNKDVVLPDQVSRVALLRQKFEDVEEFNWEGTFTPQHARDIIHFLSYISECKALVVHCEHGQSRSAAVAAACSKILGHSPLYFFENFQPNVLVYSQILLEFGLKPEEIDIE